MDERASYRFALRPWWILSHLFVVFLVVLFVNLGFWQLRRLDERQAFNAQVERNAQAAPQALPADLDQGEIDELEWSQVVVEGTYREGSDVLVANRAVDSQPGYWVVTMLERGEGGGGANGAEAAPVAVVRGFVTRPVALGSDAHLIAAPDGPVTVTGYAQRSRSGARLASGLDEGALPEITRVDLEVLGEQWGVELAPVWLQLVAQEPAAANEVVNPIPLPDLDEGPHLAYAMQWFIFATIGAVGYGFILRRNARPAPKSG
jgi:surfeit locus 1 family protein